MVANSAASPVSTMISRSPSSSRTRPSMTKNQSWPGWTRCSGIRSVGSSRILIAIVLPVGRLSIQVVRPPDAARHRADDHVVVAAHVEQRVEVDLEGVGEREQDVEADRPLAGLDPADGGRAEVGAGGELVERQAQGVAQAAQPGAHHLLDLVLLGHRVALLSRSCGSRKTTLQSSRYEPYRRIHERPQHARTVERHCDVAVVGGSAAGLAAALQLGRQRRSVIVVDAGEPRNAPAAHMHSYLGHEGLPPSELTAIGREEVRSYGGEVVAGRVVDVTRTDDDRFRVELAGGHTVFARRVLAATGLVDELPDIDGLAEHWGGDVIHCPFCHGFEVRDRRIVQIVTHPMGLHPRRVVPPAERPVHAGAPRRASTPTTPSSRPCGPPG